MLRKAVIVVAFVGLVAARPQQYGPTNQGSSAPAAAYGQPNNDLGAGMPYQFDWQVNDPLYGANYGHTQQSDGNNVNGRYFVLLPDGRLQTVVFKSDPYTGFQADVQYQGEAKYPAPNAYGPNAGQVSGSGYPA